MLHLMFWKFLFFFINLLLYLSSSPFPWICCTMDISHNFSKLSQVRSYMSTYKYDFICLSEKYLDFSTPSKIIDTDGYKLVHSDNPDNIKRCRVCIYYKESLPVRVINLPFCKEALLLVMCYNKKSDCVCNLSFPKPK